MAFGSILDVLFQLENLGFFDFLLPFLLVFAIVFGILSQISVFENNKGVNVIIAFVLGLLSIRLPFFSAFLSEISPRLGVGLTILLVALILVGMFVGTEAVSSVAWIFFAIGAIILIVVLVQTFNALNFLGFAGVFSTSELIGWIVMIAAIIGVIVAIVVSQGSGSKSKGLTGFMKKIDRAVSGK